MTNFLNKNKTTPLKKEGYFEYFETLSQREIPSSLKFKPATYYLQKARLLDGILNNLPHVIFILDYQKREYLHLNEQCEQLMGYTPQEVMKEGIPHHIRNNMHPDDLVILSQEVFQRFLEYTRSFSKNKLKKLRFSLNFRYKRKDQVYINVLQQYVVLKSDDDGNPIITLGTWTDISAFKTDNKVVFSINQYDKTTGFSVITTDTFPHVRISISKRENEVLNLLAKGLSSKQIADKLNLSLHTVNAHRRNILNKTKSKNTAELITYAIENRVG